MWLLLSVSWRRDVLYQVVIVMLSSVLAWMYTLGQKFSEFFCTCQIFKLIFWDCCKNLVFCNTSYIKQFIFFFFKYLCWFVTLQWALRASLKPMTQSVDVFFNLRLNKRMSKQRRRRWFVPMSRALWCYCNITYNAVNASMAIEKH